MPQVGQEGRRLRGVNTERGVREGAVVLRCCSICFVLVCFAVSFYVFSIVGICFCCVFEDWACSSGGLLGFNNIYFGSMSPPNLDKKAPRGCKDQENIANTY